MDVKEAIVAVAASLTGGGIVRLADIVSRHAKARDATATGILATVADDHGECLQRVEKMHGELLGISVALARCNERHDAEAKARKQLEFRLKRLERVSNASLLAYVEEDHDD